MIRRPPRATQSGSSAASDVYKRQVHCFTALGAVCGMFGLIAVADGKDKQAITWLAVAMILDGIDGPAARAWACLLYTSTSPRDS